MNQQFKQLLRKIEGRYPNDAEAQELRAYADGLFSRLEFVQAVARAESTIVEETIAAVTEKFKTIYDDNGPGAMKTAERDFRMVLRYAASSALMQDPNHIYDKLAVWYRTIIFSLVKGDYVLFGFRTLLDVAAKHLAHDDAALLVPQLRILLDELESHSQKKEVA